MSQPLPPINAFVENPRRALSGPQAYVLQLVAPQSFTELPRFAPNSTLNPIKEVDEDSSGSDSSSNEGNILGSDSSSFDDDDDVVYDENIFGEETDDDDNDFDEHVDKDVVDEEFTIDNDVFNVRVKSDFLRGHIGSDGDVQYPEFNPLVDFDTRICFNVGMVFRSNEIFRKALRQFSLENGFDYYYLHNDKYTMSAYCKNKCECPLIRGRKKCVCGKSACGFKELARRMGEDGSFQLKSFDPGHECGWQDRNTKVTIPMVSRNISRAL